MVMSPMKVLPTGCQYRSLTYNKIERSKIQDVYYIKNQKRGYDIITSSPKTLNFISESTSLWIYWSIK